VEGLLDFDLEPLDFEEELDLAADFTCLAAFFLNFGETMSNIIMIRTTTPSPIHA
jgi:hypothetical protein